MDKIIINVGYHIVELQVVPSNQLLSPFYIFFEFLLDHHKDQLKDCSIPFFQASGFHMTLGLLTRHEEDEEEDGWEPFAKV